MKTFEQFLTEGRDEPKNMKLVHDHYKLLKSLPNDRLLDAHKSMRRMRGNYTLDDVGGRDDAIKDIIHHHHGVAGYEGRIHEDAAQFDHDVVHKDYTSLKKLPTAEVHKIHQNLNRVQSKQTAADAGGKEGMISTILHHRHGAKRVTAYFEKK